MVVNAVSYLKLKAKYCRLTFKKMSADSLHRKMRANAIATVPQFPFCPKSTLDELVKKAYFTVI